MGFGGGSKPVVYVTPTPPIAPVVESEKEKAEKRAKSLNRNTANQNLMGADQLSGRGTGLRLL